MKTGLKLLPYCWMTKTRGTTKTDHNHNHSEGVSGEARNVDDECVLIPILVALVPVLMGRLSDSSSHGNRSRCRGESRV